jgi:hypothetical protein
MQSHAVNKKALYSSAKQVPLYDNRGDISNKDEVVNQQPSRNIRELPFVVGRFGTTHNVKVLSKDRVGRENE